MILISGFPYVRKEYFETFNFYPKKDDLVFLLPKIWKAKDGKVVFQPQKDNRVITTKAFFYHSQYPIIGGLLKGWMPTFPFILWNMRKKIKLVYSCSEPILLTTLYQGLWTKLFGKKHVLFSWENIPFDKKFHGVNLFLKTIVLKANFALADGIICGNNKGLDIYSRFTNKPSVVIPMSGVDDDFMQRHFVSKIFKDHDWTDKIIFTFAGAIGYRKGIHLIIKAFADLIRELPSAHLVIAGSGEYEDKIDILIEQFGISKYVTRIPWLDRISLRELLNVSDVFLYPSIAYDGWEEQFGYSMVEAALMELPVIATRSGSIEDVIKDGVNGIIIEPDNIQQLRIAMLKLGQNSELREKIGKSGREYAIQNFSNHVIAGKFYNFFNSL